jgi:hypothetical protein
MVRSEALYRWLILVLYRTNTVEPAADDYSHESYQHF